MAFFDSFDRDLDLFVPFSICLLIVIFNIKVGVMQRLTLLNIGLLSRCSALRNSCFQVFVTNNKDLVSSSCFSCVAT